MDYTDFNITLFDTTLTIGAEGQDTLVAVEYADLTGSSGVNTIDTSGFTQGSVTLSTGGGLDTLHGSTSSDEFRIDVSGLTAPSQVSVDVGGSTENQVVVLGIDELLTQAAFEWVSFTGTEPAQYVVERDGTFNLGGDVFVPGRNIKVAADKINFGARTFASNGGDITLAADDISLTGVVLDARATVGNTPGNISIQAVDDRARLTALGFVNVDWIDVGITINDAQIYGGDVKLEATADSQHFLTSNDFGGFGEKLSGKVFAQALDTWLRTLESSSVLFGVSSAESRAQINIDTEDTSGDTQTIIEATNFTASARRQNQGYITTHPVQRVSRCRWFRRNRRYRERR